MISLKLTIFLLILIPLILCSKKTPKNIEVSSLSKKWISNPVQTSSPSILTPADNTPWFADMSSDYTCTGSVDSLFQIPVVALSNNQSYNKTVIDSTIQGGKGSSLCFSISSDTENHTITIKLNYAAVVYDFDFQWHCGSFQLLEAWPFDKNKPNINNGISCHCPGGLSDPQFTPCPDYNLTGEFKYVKHMPSSQKIPTLDLCHSINTRGPSTGCVFGNGGDTDYYVKSRTKWSFLPAFKMKARTYTESLYSVFIDGVLKSNFSLSPLDPIQVLDTGLNSMVVSMTSENIPESSLSDYVVFSSDANFTNIDNIFMVHSSRFNSITEFDPLKLCPIKSSEDTGFQIRQWMIDDSLKNSFFPSKCDVADGSIQAPFPSLFREQTIQNRISQRIDPNSFALYPGETTLLKVDTQGSFGIRVEVGGYYQVTTSQNPAAVTKMSYTCDDSQNQDGFDCTFNVNSNQKGQIYVKSQDAKFVITTFNAQVGENVFKTKINPIYVSNEQVTLCVGGTWQFEPICSTSKLTYNDTDPIDQPVIVDPNNSNGNTGGGNIFANAEGKLRAWLIVVISILSLGAFVLLVYLMWPCLVVIFKLFRKCISFGAKKAIYVKNYAHETVTNDNENPNYLTEDELAIYNKYSSNTRQK